MVAWFISILRSYPTYLYTSFTSGKVEDNLKGSRRDGRRDGNRDGSRDGGGMEEGCKEYSISILWNGPLFNTTVFILDKI